MNDAALKALPTSIRELILGECSGLIDFESLSRLINLHTLNLSQTNIQDKDLQALPASIRELYLWNCNKLTEEGIKPLRERGINVALE